MTDKQFRPYPVGGGGLVEKIRVLGLWEYLWIGGEENVKDLKSSKK